MPKETTINVKCTEAFKAAMRRELPAVSLATDGEIDNLSALARAGMRLMVEKSKARLDEHAQEEAMQTARGKPGCG